MSFSTHEPLTELIATLKQTLPGLKDMLRQSGPVEVLHPAVEAIASLIARYDRGEIVDSRFPPEGVRRH